MNKMQFLKQLEKNLKCLNKEEINDILSEYSQHIDNKISEGKDEIHSISDFGDVNTLSKEILSAYSNVPYFKLKCLKNTFKYNFDCFFSSLNTRLKKFGKSFANSFSTLLEKNNFEEKHNSIISNYDKSELNQQNINHPQNKSNFFQRTLNSIVVIALQIILTIFVFIPLSIITIISVTSFSTTLILAFQGYPLLGICFISAGFSFCCLTLFLCLAKFVYPRRKKNNEKICS